MVLQKTLDRDKIGKHLETRPRYEFVSKTKNENRSCVVGSRLAAAAHDFAHPGTSNGFEEKSGSQRALRYSDDTTLERHHLASAFELLAEERTDALKTLQPNDRSEVRKWTIELVLATDLSRHGSFLAKLQTFAPGGSRRVTAATKLLMKCKTSSADHHHHHHHPALDEDDIEDTGAGARSKAATAGTPPGGCSPSRKWRSPQWRSPFLDASCADASLLCQTAVKFADLGHCTKPFALHHKWTMLIQEEFWLLGDKERETGLLPVSFLCDREKDTNIPTQQLGYFKFACMPFYSLVADLVDPNMLPLRRLNENLFQWIQLASEPTRGPRPRRASSHGSKITQTTSHKHNNSPIISKSAGSAIGTGTSASSSDPLRPQHPSGPLPPAHGLQHAPRAPGDADSLTTRGRTSLLARFSVGLSYNRNIVGPRNTTNTAEGPRNNLSRRSSSPSVLTGPQEANKTSTVIF